MPDPLGFITSAANHAARTPARASSSSEPGGGAFKDVLIDNLKQVNAMQQDANRAMEDLQTGRRNDIEGVILATQKADTAFRMLQSVRNKVMEAYEELKQIRV